ncbi:hypothetical protein [Streptomyces sp. NPDC127112]|uniref:hypothetical protein n=1 Tax=Streptomyces sp. NPDC127112 TaxID=3345364 RepID=UPI003626A43F
MRAPAHPPAIPTARPDTVRDENSGDVTHSYLSLGPPFVNGTPHRRAAWYSLAFLLRAAAAQSLDVGRQELLAGIHTGPHPGAGFSTHLGHPEVIADFMQAVHTYLDTLRQTEHAEICTSSCPLCLRDYSNMAYHPLLDWRLADDLLAVLSGGHTRTSTDRAHRSLTGLQKMLKGSTFLDGYLPGLVFTSAGLRHGVVAKHPLHMCEEGQVSADLQPVLDAALEYTQDTGRTIVADWFTRERAPFRSSSSSGPPEQLRSGGQYRRTRKCSMSSAKVRSRVLQRSVQPRSAEGGRTSPTQVLVERSTPNRPASTWCVIARTELPAEVLARALGVDITLAVEWQRAAAGDWTAHAVEVSRRNRD